MIGLCRRSYRFIDKQLWFVFWGLILAERASVRHPV